MFKLTGRADVTGLAGPLPDDVWRIRLPEESCSADVRDAGGSLAFLIGEDQTPPAGYGLYLMTGSGASASEIPGPVLGLGPELAHLNAGDIIHVYGDGRRINVMWKNSARHNALLLTEQCDNYCLMCSQPPKDRDDSWLFARARKVISLLPDDAQELSFTGGEPTLNADAFIDLLEHCQTVAPRLSLHLLSNGRRFADPQFTRRYADIGLGHHGWHPGVRP